MRKSSYHNKTLLHRNQAESRLWFARLICKNKGSNKYFNNHRYSLFFLMNIFVNQRCSAKKLFLKFYKIYSKKPVPVAYNFIQKETLLQVFEFCETFRDTFFNRTPLVQCLLLVPELSFKYIDLSIILYQNDRAVRILRN